MGRILARALRRCASSGAIIISRTALMRLSSKNMCSVRHRPMPSAPNLRAWVASRGVSPLVRTLSTRSSSAQPMKRPKSPVSSASWVSILPTYTLPVEPSSEIKSPSCITVPSAKVMVLFSSDTLTPDTPATQQVPMPRATTAACEVMPPRAVITPSADTMPSISSGEVS